jgi:Fe-only nitrogenase accessory protein AnfO
MKIATYVNEREEVTVFGKPGSIYLYDQVPGGWEGEKITSFVLGGAATMSEIRASLRAVASLLEGCTAFLVRETRGLYNVYLEDLGFHTWKSEGALVDQLENVARRETERLKEGESSSRADSCGCGRGSDCRSTEDCDMPLPEPEPIGEAREGQYRLNLAEFLENFPHLTSREILEPFLEAGEFSKLEIICDHLPRWLIMKLDALSLDHELSPLGLPGEWLTLTVCHPSERKAR